MAARPHATPPQALLSPRPCSFWDASDQLCREEPRRVSRRLHRIDIHQLTVRLVDCRTRAASTRRSPHRVGSAVRLLSNHDYARGRLCEGQPRTKLSGLTQPREHFKRRQWTASRGGGGGSTGVRSPALRVCHPVVPSHRMGVAWPLHWPWMMLTRSTGCVLADLPQEVQRLSYEVKRWIQKRHGSRAVQKIYRGTSLIRSSPLL